MDFSNRELFGVIVPQVYAVPIRYNTGPSRANIFSPGLSSLFGLTGRERTQPQSNNTNTVRGEDMDRCFRMGCLQ
jgi:hypothetical protein